MTAPLTSNPGRLRELADKPGLYVIASTAREVAAALRAYADLLERPQETTKIHELALQGLREDPVGAYVLLSQIAMKTDPSLHPNEPTGANCKTCYDVGSVAVFYFDRRLPNMPCPDCAPRKPPQPGS